MSSPTFTVCPTCVPPSGGDLEMVGIVDCPQCVDLASCPVDCLCGGAGDVDCPDCGASIDPDLGPGVRALIHAHAYAEVWRAKLPWGNACTCDDNALQADRCDARVKGHEIARCDGGVTWVNALRKQRP